MGQKKSRGGCLRCKTRRVKCDEQRPSCRACERYLAPCIYPAQSHGRTPRPPSSTVYKDGQPAALDGYINGPSDMSSDDSVLGLSADQRRRLELKLLHNYMTNMVNAPSTTLDSVFEWGHEVPRLALTDDCILYGLLAHSALHLRLTSDDVAAAADLETLPQKYFALALRLHRRAAADISADTAESVCFAGLIILMHLFALVQTLQPDTPPLEWLSVGRGVGTVIHLAQKKLGPVSTVSRFVHSRPNFHPDVIFTEENRAQLLWLIQPITSTDTELDDSAAEAVYCRVLSYIGHARSVMAHGPVNHVKRALAGFAIWTPNAFHEYLSERRPRACIIMAYFFGMWTTVEHLWVVGQAGRLQMKGIQQVLPPAWQDRFRAIQAEFHIESSPE